MIRMSVLYPAGDGVTFDHDYYATKHVPMCTEAFGCRAEIDKGLNGPYVGAVHFFFDDMDAFQNALKTPKLGEIMADVANYTNATPVQQISTTA
jgi:uncharacterized protein (TIGR02118 family)